MLKKVNSAGSLKINTKILPPLPQQKKIKTEKNTKNDLRYESKQLTCDMHMHMCIF